MCGIVGCISRVPVLPLAPFLEMRDTLAHRGPDDAGVWRSAGGSVMLGSRRLAILDLSPDGHQPMLDENGNVAIIFNGEIYNYVELGDELKTKGYRFRSLSDTEVLLKAYEAWGSGCLERLNGMFAFAIWDERRQELFAARDRFGEKPFYYHHDSDRAFLLFASEIKALLASGLVNSQPNGNAIFRYLAHHEIDAGADTLFQGIMALPPAHALLYFRPGETLRIWRYWDLDSEAEVRLSNDQAYAERLHDLLTDAVRIRLRSDVPVGSSLSGGLDSSSIVSLIARERAGNAQKTFSARFHDPRFDEGRYIRTVVERMAVDSHSVHPDPSRLPEEMDALTWHQDHPFYGSSVYAQWAVMRLARDQSVTVLLDGQGGDEVLAGYPSYFGAYYRDLLKGLHWAKLFNSVYGYVREHGSRTLPIIFSGLLPYPLRFSLKRFFRPLGIRPEFERQWRGWPARTSHKFKSDLQEDLYLTLTRTQLPALLRYADRNSMAFSREVRLPFLDHRVVEFVFAAPADQKIRGVTTKVILRDAIRGIVPEEIRIRKDKIGFATPECSWLRGPLQPWVEGVWNSSAFRERSWVEPSVVRRAWREFLSGRDSWHTAIWRWLSLEVWARTFLDSGLERFRRVADAERL